MKTFLFLITNCALGSTEEDHILIETLTIPKSELFSVSWPGGTTTTHYYFQLSQANNKNTNFNEILLHIDFLENIKGSTSNMQYLIYCLK